MTVKQQILLMLTEAQNLMLTEATVQGKTFDEAEMADADVEDIYEDVRSKFNALEKAVADYLE